MKKPICFLIVVAMLFSLPLCLSSCFKDWTKGDNGDANEAGADDEGPYELWRETDEDGDEIVMYVETDPFTLAPGEQIKSKLISYRNGELDYITPCWVLCQFSSENHGNPANKDENGVSYFIATYGSGSLKVNRRFNFETNQWIP